MWVIVREHQNVAGLEIDHVACVGEPRAASAVRQHVEERYLLRAREVIRRRVQTELGLDAPRRRELGVEVEGPIEANRLQNFGESVHDFRRLRARR